MSSTRYRGGWCEPSLWDHSGTAHTKQKRHHPHFRSIALTHRQLHTTAIPITLPNSLNVAGKAIAPE
jgi:hypothetical protein